MLSREENELITAVDHDTPMGRMLRRYWFAACLSEDLPEPGGDPIPLQLLGEKLVAYRDFSGTVGILDQRCPHRGADLTLARAEDCGLRCVYHGWKVGTDGSILDTPNEPDSSRLKERVTARTYPVEEHGGLIWIYMGPRDKKPPLPMLEWSFLDANRIVAHKVLVKCNWLQCLEGSIDSSHITYLHSDIIKSSVDGRTNTGQDFDPTRTQKTVEYLPSNDGHPRLEVEDTPYGFRYAAVRTAPDVEGEARNYVRTTLFIAPTITMIPDRPGFGTGPFYTPVDLTHTMMYVMRYRLGAPVDEDIVRSISGIRKGIDAAADGTRVRNPENHWLQDRDAMRRGDSWVGIPGIISEDTAIVESLGPIYDRSTEHVGMADVAVVHARRLLLESLRVSEAGGDPVGVGGDPVDYPALYPWEEVIPGDQAWQAYDPRALRGIQERV
jgi:phthalate 4,5-dioxygenase